MSFVFNRLGIFERRGRLGHAGITSMEVAITFALFITFSFGVIDLSRYFFSQQALTTLVTMTARQEYVGSLPAFFSDTTVAQNLITANGLLLDPTQITHFTMSSSPGGSLPNGQTAAYGVNVLKVTATYEFKPLIPFLDTLLGPMTATMTYQY